MGSTVVTDQNSKYSYYAGSKNTYYLGSSAVPSGRNLLAIPQTIIDVNQEATLEQNPGWYNDIKLKKDGVVRKGNSIFFFCIDI